MSNSTKWLLALGGGIAIWFALKARALSNLIFSPGTVQGIQFDGISPVIQITVLVQNTAGVPVTLLSMAGNVFTADAGSSTLIGNISTFQPVTVPGNSSALVVLNVRMRLLGIVNDVIAAFQTRNYTKVLDFRCSANVGMLLPVPVNFKIAVGA